MSDESAPHGSQPELLEGEVKAPALGGESAAPSPEAAPTSERERADSITPLSSPIVSVGDETVPRPERAAPTGSEPPAPSARRLVPPPKPKGYDSKPPQDAGNRPYFPPPAALPASLSHQNTAPSMGASALPRVQPSGSDPPTPSKPPQASAGAPIRTPPPAIPSVSSRPPAQRGAGSLPPGAGFPGTRGPSLTPPTLPSGTAAPRYPWLSSATLELAAEREGTASDATTARETTARETTARETTARETTARETTARETTDRAARESSPRLDRESSPRLDRESSPRLDREPSAPQREAVLPPARRSNSQSPSDPSASRAAVLPRATRDPQRRSSTPPPKPRIVPPRAQKETPTVAIQAMRIIAIGTADSSPQSSASGVRSDAQTSSPELGYREFDSRPEASAPDGARDYTGELFAGIGAEDPGLKDIPPLPANALEDAPTAGLELFSDEIAAPPIPPEAGTKLPSGFPPAAAEPTGLELFPLPSGEAARDIAQVAPTAAESPSKPAAAVTLGAALATAAAPESATAAAPESATAAAPESATAAAPESATAAVPESATAAVPESGPTSERSPDSVEILDEATPSARRRPPPPRRNSMPSAPSDGQLQTSPSVPPERAHAEPALAPQASGAEVVSRPPPQPSHQVAPSVVADAPPRQPPPAPSRVPREPPARPERAKDSASASAKDSASASASNEAGSETAERPKTRVRRPWWEELFGEDFSRATTRLSDAQIDQEVSFIEESLGVAPGGAVLDLGCGAGHHAVELAARGYGTVGYDLSLHQLALAQEVAQERGQKLNFMHGDMREMAFEEVFDGMYCWNTTFGYFEEEKNLVVAERMFAALKPGGTLLLDVANRDFVALDQPSSVWYEGDSAVCMDDMCIDFFTSRLRVKRSLILDDGRTRECHYSIRLYSLHELGKLLHEVGFRVTEASGHPATPGVFLGQSSPRIIVLAQKP